MLKTKAASLTALLLAAILFATACSPQTALVEPQSSAPAERPATLSQGEVARPDPPAQSVPQEEPDPLPQPEESPPAEPEPREEPAPSSQPEEPSAPETEPAEAAEPLPTPAAEPDKSYAVAGASLTTLSLAGAPSFDLSIPTTFKIYRPDKAAISTTYASYYLMGTSDPSQPLYFQGEEVARQGTRGTWGVLVNLSMGNNTFTAKQGDSIQTVTITRNAVPGTQPISAIVKTSMYPATQGGVKAGGNLPVECVAPSGATVTASFGGQSVTLQQTANANAGIPATYRGELPVGTDYPAGVTGKQGKVSYRLTWGGTTTDYQSEGEVYVAGAGSYIAVRVTAYQGFVYDDPSVVSVFREKLKTGATDYVYSENNTHYRLYSGGYIPKSLCEIIEGEVKIGNKVSSVSTAISGNRERFTFKGISRTAYRAYYGEGDTFVLTLYNTNGAQSVDVSGSRLVSSVKATQNDNSSVTYVFQLKNPGLYWGYNVTYSGTDLTLSLSCKPAVSSGAQPLSGITVVLDPGHGKVDTGALGFAGTDGPTENRLNLAVAYSAKAQLEAMGARVLLTRAQEDEFLTLDQRLQVYEQSDADLFISLHHNSLAESSDGNKTSGSEIWYHTRQSATSAQRILQSYLSVTGRSARKVNQGYFRVTILPTSPSMLIELGFMCNPAEYERLCTAADVQRSAQGVAEGILAAFR